MPRRCLVIPCVLLLSLLACGTAGAQEPPPAPDAPPAQEPRVTWRPSLEWISAVRWLDPAETSLNPGNSVLRLPEWLLQTELRPNLRVEVGSRLTVVARPRVLAYSERSWANGTNRREVRDTTANWTELYLSWRPAGAVQFTYGLQNFQWGPAELLAPSNRIFHETGIFRDPLYYVRGRHLARVNISPGREWSIIAIGELGDNGEPDFNAGAPFRRQALVKIEYSSAGGRGYVGVTGGAREAQRGWFGEYASVSLTEGFSAYVDASHQRGSDAWYPVRGIEGEALFARRDEDAEDWRTLALAGLRYTFASGVDARGELLFSESGYTRGEMPLAAAAAASATTRAEFAPYLAPGLEFLGKRLGLLSVRFPDLPPAKHLVITTRYLRSFTDDSGVVFVTSSVDAAAHLVVFGSATATHGDETAEFSRLARAYVVGGVVVTW